MKRKLIIALMLSLLFLYGCNSQEINNSNNSAQKKLTTTINTSSNSSDNKISSGLLLGLSKYKSYRTLWISPKDNLVMECKDILTPHGADFWKISSIIGSDESGDHEIQFLSSHHPDEKPKLITHSKFEQDQNDDDFIVDISNHITFVSNNYISFNRVEYYAPKGAAHGYAFSSPYITDLQTLSEENTFDAYSIFGEENKDYFYDLSKSIEPHEGFYGTAGDYASLINRKYGKFELEVGQPVRRDGKFIGYQYVPVPMKLPTKITSFDELTPRAEIIKNKFPESVDALTSYNKDYIVVQFPRKLIIYSLINEEINNMLMEIPLEEYESIIMAQWAVGEYVDIWTKDLSIYMTIR